MNTAIFFPLLLGFFSVLQAGLNRQVGARAGGTGGLDGLKNLSFWYVLPGILGFSLVAGIPWAISRAGSLPVFLAIVAAQIVGSMVWDFFKEGQAPDYIRFAGSALALAGASLVAFSGAAR